MPGHRFFIGIRKPVLDAPDRRLLSQVRPSGVILFGRNVRSAPQLAELTAGLRRLLGADLLICLDHEGGRVNRLKDIVGVVPSAQQLGFLQREDWANEHGRLTGRLLCEAGVNINLAPVLDLHLRPKTDNSVPDRCWSRDPSVVARLAGAFLGGMQPEGVIGCGKHFLGYGAADKDPHLLLPRVNRTRRQILTEDALPYVRLIPGETPRHPASAARQLHLIMLSHAHLRAFHGNRLTPACVSPRITGALLRETLAYRGATITDDLEMGAITRTMPLPDAVVRCLNLGVDLILICHTAKAIRTGFSAAQHAKRDGQLSSRTQEESRARVASLRQRARISSSFSQRRFDAIVADIRRFTRKVFAALPPELRVVDERWGPIGEK